jgi:hypothetical protein
MAVDVGTFSITQVNDPSTGMPYASDKLGKDNNFRGLTLFNNTLYTTKGSGSNGVNTVYQVGATGSLPTLANAEGALSIRDFLCERHYSLCCGRRRRCRAA